MTFGPSLPSPHHQPFSKALKVTERDFTDLIQSPRIDEPVLPYLPALGGSASPGFSPYWEKELSQLDKRLGTGVRLTGVASSVAEHLSLELAARGGGREHRLVQECMLLCDLCMHSARGIMSARRKISDLRRHQVTGHLAPQFGPGLVKLIQDKELGNQSLLFGGKFCDKLKERADHVANEEVVRRDAQAVRKASKRSKPKKKKSKRSASATSGATTSRAAAPSALPTQARAAPSAGASSSGKRPSTAPGPKPKKAKKHSKGKGV